VAKPQIRSHFEKRRSEEDNVEEGIRGLGSAVGEVSKLREDWQRDRTKMARQDLMALGYGSFVGAEVLSVSFRLIGLRL